MPVHERSSMRFPCLRVLAGSVLLAMLAAASAARAQSGDLAELERLRATTASLIEALVEGGQLSREKADRILSEAAEKGRKAAAAAQAPGVRAAAAGDAVRVPYVPEPVRRQLREEIRTELLAQARSENWGAGPALPGWLERIELYGDLRVRYQDDRFATGNGTPADYFQTGDIVTNFADLSNSLVDQERLRLRARLGARFEVADWVAGGLRISTGSLNGPVSTSSTAGDPSNRYGIKLDRGYAQLTPVAGLRLDAGRMPNPFWSTEIQHAPDLGFDGLAAAWQLREGAQWKPFAAAGVFPLRDNTFGARPRLLGMQLGTSWQPSDKLALKLALARYDFRNLQGSAHNDYADPAYLSGEYERGYRQRGNTLFQINQDPYDPGFLNPVYGLASKFEVQAITVGAELGYFAPLHIGFVGELVRNQGFDEAEILARTGSSLASLDKRNRGYLYRLTLGDRAVNGRGDWQFALTYRYLERDATPDAFTDPDFLLGGTNNKGYVLGLTYGIAANTSLGLRYLSAESIDSPTFNPSLAPLRVNTLQFDLNLRF